MVKTFGESADFTAFKVVDGDIYRVAWAKTMQVEKQRMGKLRNPRSVITCLSGMTTSLAWIWC